MSAEFVYELDRIDFKNSTGKDIICSSVVEMGKIHGVALTDIAKDEVGAVKVTGVFVVQANKTDVYAVGDLVYYDATNAKATKSDSKPVLGFAVDTKANGAEVVTVALMPNLGK